MAGKLTNVLVQEILNYYLRAQAASLAGGAGTTYQLRLYVSACTSASAGTEQSEGGYSAQTFTFAAPSAGGTSGYEISNSATITFGPATASWAQTTYCAVWNEETTPEYLAWADLATARTLATDDSLEFAAGALEVRIDWV